MSHPMPDDASEVFEIWPDRPADHTDGRTEKTFANPDPRVPERWVRNVTVPTLTRFAASGGDGHAVLIVPGGGFHFVSIDNEGYDLARAFAAVGIEAFVLKYRTAPMPEADAEIAGWLARDFAAPCPAPGETAPPDAPLLDRGRDLGAEDARQAMRVLGTRPGADAARLGAIGFSAGGGIVADLAYASPPELRPAWVAPIYPAWRPGLGIPAGAPPSFLAAATDDATVAPMSTARLAEALHRAGVPVEFHLYANGGHGFGIRRQGTRSDRWFDELLAWLAALA